MSIRKCIAFFIIIFINANIIRPLIQIPIQSVKGTIPTFLYFCESNFKTGLEVGLTEIKEGRYGTLNGLNGNLNKGSYNISVDENNDEESNALSYTHQSMVSSEGSIAGFKSRSRLIVSSYPDAYNLAFYGSNNSGGNLNASV